jgi:hypothetical protein
MALKDMKFTKTELKERNTGSTIPSPNEDKYPYGLRISLDSATLKKLGLKSMPKVGSDITLKAQACVVSCSVNERLEGGSDRRLELQIERMDLNNDPDSALEAMERGLDEADEEE